MKNELRTHILVLLNERVASRSELAKELGVDWEKVRYELGALAKEDPPLIRVADKRKIKGTYELFYEALVVPYIDQSEWPSVPPTVKARLRSNLLDLLVDDAVMAIEEGTFDSLESAHMSWTPLIVDQQGWNDLTEVLKDALTEIIRVRNESKIRLMASGETGISCSASILGYHSHNRRRRVGAPTT